MVLLNLSGGINIIVFSFLCCSFHSYPLIISLILPNFRSRFPCFSFLIDQSTLVWALDCVSRFHSAFTHSFLLIKQSFFTMRSSAILVAALVGFASAGMPGWIVKSSETASGGGLGPSGKPHLGPGPVSERPRPDISLKKTDHHNSGYPEDHHTKSEHHRSGGSFPTDYRKEHHPERHHNSGGIFPSGGISPSGGPKHHRSEQRHYHHIPTGSGVGPTGTGHGGSPPTTTGPLTTTITATSDVTSMCSID